VGPRAGLVTEARGKILSSLPGIEPRSPGRLARNQTKYLAYRSQNSCNISSTPAWDVAYAVRHVGMFRTMTLSDKLNQDHEIKKDE